MAVWVPDAFRATRDLDLLGPGDASPDRAEVVFKEPCRVTVEPDGIEFDPATVRAELIREDQRYLGTRVKLEARIAGAVRFDFDGPPLVAIRATFARRNEAIPAGSRPSRRRNVLPLPLQPARPQAQSYGVGAARSRKRPYSRKCRSNAIASSMPSRSMTTKLSASQRE